MSADRSLVFAAMACLAIGVTVMPAQAQDEAAFVEAFAGDWLAFDPALSENGSDPCRITLSGEPAEDEGASYVLVEDGCSGALGSVTGWSIVSGQLALSDTQGELRATLGGNQNRMTGDTIADEEGMARAIVMERAGTEPAAFDASALAEGACLYIGYTASCAEPATLARNAPSETAESDQISVLVNLNARAEPRPDAPVVDIVPKQTCLAVTQCVDASDGRWCEARIGTETGWMRQQAVRSGQWPVLTYRSGC